MLDQQLDRLLHILADVAQDAATAAGMPSSARISPRRRPRGRAFTLNRYGHLWPNAVKAEEIVAEAERFLAVD